jgi:hypothetical protein
VLASVLTFSSVACRRNRNYYLEKGKQRFAKRQYAGAEINFRKAIQAIVLG